MKKMNKNFALFLIISFIALCINVFGQEKSFDVKITGSGSQSILLIPGFASSGDVWNDTRKLFEKDFTCYTFTMAGFAGTVPESNPSFEKWEDAIASFIKDKRINQPVIIGHSMGGGLALALAADYPELIGKIVVVDALPCLAALMNPAFKSKEINDCSEMTNKMTMMSNEEFFKMQKSSIPRLLADSSMQEVVVEWSMKSDRKTFAEMYCDFSNTDLREKIKSVRCSNMIMLESYFKNMKPAIGEQYKNLKDSNLQYADNGLHFIMFDDTNWYNKKLTDFVYAK
jgi:pimeloyl-ACP methyl ester carboxylesterase